MDLRNYAAEIHSLTEGLLATYLDRVESRGAGEVLGKEINDPIWGTVVLEPQEVVVLDSPLLQRLRRIRQLGVAHLVYPSAVHTRLEHSLGVCHQVGRLAASINSHASLDGDLIRPNDVRLLRMTGLCHDVGHGLMSHVVENALRDDGEVRSLIKSFRKSLGKDGKVQLSEMAAHFMLSSPAVERLLAVAYRTAGLPPEDNLGARMSRIVVGESVGDEVPLMHELISGPFDADKLDYMPRDAAMCGVPVVTDINRLIQKVRAVGLATAELPPEIAATVGQVVDRHTIVGIAPSGASTLDEVALGRSLMFDKIYRHHKVRAAEVMVASAVAQLSPHLGESALVPFRLTDEEFLSLSAKDLVEPGGTLGSAAHIGLDLIKRLHERELFVRAFAFSQHLPQDPYRGDPANRQAIESMIRECSTGVGRNDFVTNICRRLTSILDALSLDHLVSGLPDADLAPYVFVDPPAASIPDSKPDPNRAYLIGAEGEPRKVNQVNAELRGWSDAYVNTHDVGYVFCLRELSPYVFIGLRN